MDVLPVMVEFLEGDVRALLEVGYAAYDFGLGHCCLFCDVILWSRSYIVVDENSWGVWRKGDTLRVEGIRMERYVKCR